MSKTIKIIIGVAVLILIIGVTWNFILEDKEFGQKTNSKEPIKIGVVTPLTGSAALWGQGSLDMMNIAVDEINSRGGIDGRMLKLVAEDGKCQSEPAVTALEKLINQDGVKFVLGGHCSPETAAMAPVLEENKVFGLAGVSTASGILDKYSYAFRTSPANLVQARLIAKLAYEKYGIKKIALITEQTAFAKSISADFITAFKEIGGEVLDEENVVTDQTDFKTELLKIKSKNPDAIFVSPQSPAVGIAIMKQIDQLKIDIKLTGNTVFISKKVYTDSGNLLPLDAFTVAPYADLSNEKTNELLAKYKSKFGKDVPYNNFFVGAAYDGVHMLEAAIAECGEDPACVRDYFFALKDFQGAVSVFNFDDNGDPELNSWREQRIVDGNEVYETVEEQSI